MPTIDDATMAAERAALLRDHATLAADVCAFALHLGPPSSVRTILTRRSTWQRWPGGLGPASWKACSGNSCCWISSTP